MAISHDRRQINVIDDLLSVIDLPTGNQITENITFRLVDHPKSANGARIKMRSDVRRSVGRSLIDLLLAIHALGLLVGAVRFRRASYSSQAAPPGSVLRSASSSKMLAATKALLMCFARASSFVDISDRAL